MLYFTGTAVNVQSLLGFIFIVGINVSNAVLMTDFAQELRHAGGPDADRGDPHAAAEKSRWPAGGGGVSLPPPPGGGGGDEEAAGGGGGGGEEQQQEAAGREEGLEEEEVVMLMLLVMMCVMMRARARSVPAARARARARVSKAGRPRPVRVTMTALAAFCATIPGALALERGSEANAPLARAILGGLLAGEPATLVAHALNSLFVRDPKGGPVQHPTTGKEPETPESSIADEGWT